MNALSQISQITQLVVEIGAGAEPHLQACIDALRNLKEPKLSPECGVCGDRFPIDDFDAHECKDECEKYIRCELCSDLFDREWGEWLSVSLEQPLRKTKKSSGIIVRDLCLECVEDNIEDFEPEFKTDKFVFKPEGCLHEDNISSVLKDHAEMVAEMKWCVRCDLCPQDENKKNEIPWCAECYFQHGEEIDEEEDEQDDWRTCDSCGEMRNNKTGKAYTYDDLEEQDDGNWWCKECVGTEELCENCGNNPIAPKVLCGFEKWCEFCDTALYSTKIDFVK